MTFKGFKIQLSEMKEIMVYGFPKMIEMFAMDALDAANRVFLIMCGGVDAVTLFSVPFRLLMLAAMAPNSFALALTPVSSANIGAKRPDKSAYAFKVCAKSILIITGVLLIVYLLLADYLVIPFVQSESMMVLEPQLVDIIRIDAFMIPAIGTAFVCGSMLQSMRHPMLALLMTLIRTVLTTVVFACLYTTSVEYMCVGMVVVNIAAALISLLVTRVSIKNMILANGPNTA
jgi:Na+-driven multidrug efflux pump